MTSLIPNTGHLARAAGERLRRLELGCGERPTPGYLHQDVTPQPGVRLDFTCNPWELPLPDGSLDEVLALGLVEHLRFAEVHATLAKVRALLVPGGAFLFDVPDMQVWSEYLFHLTHGRSELVPFEPQHVWSTFYGWQRWPGDEHKSGWTRESLLVAVKEAGFSAHEEGVQVFLSRGFERRRFTRPGDAHLYLRAVK
jgi:predicted SAM-dependent methyltransferase